MIIPKNKFMFKLFLLFALLLINNLLYSQDSIIFSENENLVNCKFDKSHDFYDTPMFDFYDSFRNGNYYIVNEKDFQLRKRKVAFYVKGSYIDSLRDGPFTYYYRNAKSKEYLPQLVQVCE